MGTTSQEPYTGSFAALYDSLLDPSYSPALLRQYLNSALPRLRDSATAFKPRQKDGLKSTTGSEKERNLVDKLSEILDVDQSDLLTVFKSYCQDRAVKVESLPDPAHVENSDFFDTFTSFYFSERLVIFSILKYIFNASADPTSLLHNVASSITSSLQQNDSTSKSSSSTSFFVNLINAYVDRTKRTIPKSMQSLSRLCEFYSKQLLREQVAIVNVLLVAFYSDCIQPSSQRTNLAFTVLNAINDTEWGEKQANGDIFNQELASLTFQVQSLLVILSIEVLSIDYPENYNLDAFTLPLVQTPPPSESELVHPKSFEKMHNLVISLSSLRPNVSKPLVIAWSYILKQFTDSLLNSTFCPPAYLSFAQQLVKLSSDDAWKTTPPQGSSSLPASNNNNNNNDNGDNNNDDDDEINEKDLLRSKLSGHTTWQEAFMNCLQEPNSIFSSIYSLSNSSLISQPSADSLIYLSCLRLVFSLLCRIVHPAHYQPQAFDELVNVFTLLYSRPDATALRLEFFPPPIDPNTSTSIPDFRLGQQHFLNTAISRFPLLPENALRILSTLNSSPSSSDDLSEQAQISDLSWRIANSLDSLSELAHITQSTLVRDRGGNGNSGTGQLAAGVDIPITQSVRIPKGTLGSLLATPEQGASKMVIGWDLSKKEPNSSSIYSIQGWSAWSFFADIFEEVSAGGSGSSSSSSSSGAGGGSRLSNTSKRLQQRQQNTSNSMNNTTDVFSSPSIFSSNIVTYPWDSDDQRNSTVAYAFQLLRTCTAHDVSTASFVIQRMAGDNFTAEDVIRNIFRVFEKAMSQMLHSHKQYPHLTHEHRSKIPSHLIVQSGLHIFASLVHTYTGAVWSLIRALSNLFGSRSFESGSMADSGAALHPILAVDKVEGKYSTLISLLNLIQQLLQDARKTSLIDPPDLKNIKNVVLRDALAWVLQEVWSNFDGWKYIWLGERYEIGRRCCEIITMVLEDTTRQHSIPLAPPSSTSSSSKTSSTTPLEQTLEGPQRIIYDTFLSETSAASFSAPIVSLITTNGLDNFESLLADGREDVFNASEKTIRAALKLASSILTCKRTLSIAGLNIAPILTLERLLFVQNEYTGSQNQMSNFASQNSYEPIVTLTNAISDLNVDKDIRIAVIYILIELSTLSFTPKIPDVASSTLQQVRTSYAKSNIPQASSFSLISHLGGPVQTRVFLSQLIYDLSESFSKPPYHDWNVGVWDLLTSWVDNQPALAIAFLRTVNINNNSTTETKTSKPRTAIEIAIKHLGNIRQNQDGQDSSDNLNSYLLTQSVVRFLHYAWQHLAEYAVELKPARSNEQFWDDLFNIVNTIDLDVDTIANTESLDEIPKICSKLMILYHVFHIIALDLQFDYQSKSFEDEESSSSTTSGSLSSSPCVRRFLGLLKPATKFMNLNMLILDNSYDARLQNTTREWITENFRGLELTQIRKPPFGQPYDGSRKYGLDYLYSLDIAAELLEGYIDPDFAENTSLIDSAINMVELLNYNWSLADVQISITRAWAFMLQAAMASMGKTNNNDAAHVISDCINSSLDLCASQCTRNGKVPDLSSSTSFFDKTFSTSFQGVEIMEDDEYYQVDGGDLAATIHNDRLTIVSTLAEMIFHQRSMNDEKTYKDAFSNIQKLAVIARNNDLGPIASLRNRKRSPCHRPFFKALFFSLTTLESKALSNNNTNNKSGNVGNIQAGINLSAEGFGHLRAMESIVKSSTICLKGILSSCLVQETADSETESDLSLLVSVYRQLLSLTLKDPSHSLVAYWLAMCRELDIFGQAFEVLVKLTTSINDGRPVFAQHVVCFLLNLANFSQAAEAMALEGVMGVLSNNALTPTAQAGQLTPLGPYLDGFQQDREPNHLIFCSMVGLVTRLVETLGSSTLFMDQAVAFVRLYDAQFANAMNFDVDSGERLPFGRLDEIHATLSLYNVIMKRICSSWVLLQENNDIRMAFIQRSLYLLPQIVFFLTHPNHLLSLIEPIGARERLWLDVELENEPGTGVSNKSDDEPDVLTRPGMACLTHELLVIAGTIVSGLHDALSAFDTFRKDVVDWPPDMTFISPSAKFVTSEPASIGTLYDLLSSCLDINRQLQSKAKPSGVGVGAGATSAAANGGLSKDGTLRKGNEVIEPPIPLLPFSREKTIASAIHTYEATLVLAASQMGYWLYRGPSIGSNADKIQREISGDLSTDLLDYIKKSPSAPAVAPQGTPLRRTSFNVGASTREQVKFEKGGLYSALNVFVESFLKLS